MTGDGDMQEASEGERWRGVLIAHPDAGGGPVETVSVSAVRTGDLMALEYRVSGDISALSLPTGGQKGRTDGLWRHTCMEVFISGEGDAYYEFNFSPSGAWACYRFGAYRADATEPAVKPAAIKIATTSTHFHLYTDLDLGALSIDGAAPLRFGLSAVIEDNQGDKTFWALAHGEGAPDFHRASCFVGRIP